MHMSSAEGLDLGLKLLCGLKEINLQDKSLARAHDVAAPLAFTLLSKQDFTHREIRACFSKGTSMMGTPSAIPLQIC